jgi:hypothetical protein
MNPKFFKSVLALSFLLVETTAVFAESSASDAPNPKWEADIKRFEEWDKKDKPGGTIFVGSSTIGMWMTLKEDFAGYDVTKRGFGGSEMIDVVRYADRFILNRHPEMIVLYEGTNDLFASHKTPEQVFSDFKQFVALVQEKLPKTKLAVVSLVPTPHRIAVLKQIKETNQLISGFVQGQENLIYMDMFSAIVDEKGQPKPEYFKEDMVHPNAAGYEVWTKVIKPYLPKS